MKRKRGLLSVAVLLVFIVALYHSINLIQVNDTIKRAILARTAPYIKGEVSIDFISLGLHGLNIRNVQLKDREGLKNISVKSIRIILSYRKLFSSGFNFVNSVERIEFRDPRIYIPFPMEKKAPGGQAIPMESQQAGQPGRTEPVFSGFPIDVVIVRHGQVILGSEKHPILTLTSINGNVSLGQQNLSCILTGEFLHTSENVAIAGSIAPDFSSFDFKIELSRASLESPLTLPSGLTITRARADMDISVRRAPGENEDISVNGGLNLDSINILLPGKFSLSNLSGYIAIQDNVVACNELSVTFLGRTAVLSGSTGNLFNPRLNLTMFIDSVNLASKEISAMLPLPLSGQVSGTISCTGKPESLDVAADLSSSRVTLQQATLTNPQIKVSLQNNAIIIHQAKGVLLGGSIEARGRYSFNPDSGLAIVFQARNMDVVRAASTSGPLLSPLSRFSIKGDLKKNRAGLFYSVFSSGSVASLPNLGDIAAEVQSNGTDVSLKVSDANGLAVLQGFIKNAYAKGLFPKKPEIMASLRTKKIHPWLFTKEKRSVQEEKPGDLAFALSSTLNGDSKKLAVNGKLRINGALLSGPVSFNGTIRDPLSAPDVVAACASDSLSILGILGPLSCQVERKNKRLQVSSFSFTPSVRGRFSDNGDALDGDLVFDNWNLSAYINRDTEIARLLNLGGIANGTLSLTGTKKNPAIAIKGSLINGRLGKLTGLTARIQASGDANRFSFSEFTVENQDRRFLFADNFTMTKEGITGKIKIDRLNLGSILGPSLGLRGLVFINFDCSAAGKSLLTAAIDSFSYKNFSLSYFKADMYENNGAANIKAFSFGNENISCEASGFFPFPYSTAFDTSSDSVDVLVQFKGDILKEVAQQTSIVKDRFGARTQGRGKGKLHIVGRTGALSLQNGFFEIGADGKAALYPKYIFPGEISKFKLYAGINNAVANIAIEGTIQGKTLKIVNEPAGPGENSLDISALNLTLGVFKFLTSEGGVPLNVPGIIPPGEYGEFELFDKNGVPGLRLTGPTNHPHIIGKMRVHNTRFTFPMLIDIAGADQGRKDLIDWDCTIMPGKNFRYYYDHRRTSPLPFIGKVLPKKIKDQIDRGVYSLITYPFCELTLERSSWLHLMGMPGHKDFKVSGKIASTQGTVHYAGLNFTQDIDVGVEFDEQDNIPTLWGSATTIVRTGGASDFGKEITVTLYMRDPKTGVEYKRGKFNEFRLIPSSNMTINDDGELVDSETDAYQEMFGKNPEKSAKDLAMTEGKAMFGNLLSRYVSGYLERKILAFGRTNINPLLGFNATPDVMRFQIESDRFFNYIDMSLWTMEQFRKDLIQNMEFVTGKYFLGGSVFFNYSSQVDLNQNSQGLEVERLHHRLGLELTPWRYLYFNMDYEIGGLTGVIGDGFNARDFRSNVRLRIPLNKVINIFTPEEEKHEKK